MVKTQRPKNNSFMPFVLEILRWKSITMKMADDSKSPPEFWRVSGDEHCKPGDKV